MTLVMCLILLNGLDEARGFIENEQMAKAIPILEQVLAEGEEPEALRLLVKACSATRNFDLGLAYSEAALKAYPEDSSLCVQVAELYLAKFSKNPMGWMTGKGTYIDLLEKAIRLEPHHVDSYRNLIGFYSNAPSMVGGSTKEALAWCDKLFAVDEVSGRLARANVYVTKNDEPMWREQFEHLLAHEPNGDVYYGYGMALTSIDKHGEAIKVFDQGARLNHVPSLYQSARSRLLAEVEFEQAVTLFDQFLNTTSAGNPYRSGAFWRKGQALAALQRYEEARQCYQDSLALDNDDRVKKDLDRLPSGGN